MSERGQKDEEGNSSTLPSQQTCQRPVWENQWRWNSWLRLRQNGKGHRRGGLLKKFEEHR